MPHCGNRWRHDTGGAAVVMLCAITATAVVSLTAVAHIGSTLGARAHARTVAEMVAVAYVDHGATVAAQVAAANMAAINDVVAWGHRDRVSSSAQLHISVDGVVASATASNAPTWP